MSPESSERQLLTVVELANAKVIGNVRMVATNKDVVVWGVQSLYGAATPQDHYLLGRRRFRVPRRRRGTALLLGAANSDNYYHWLLDSLPRWNLLQQANFLDYDYVLLHDRPCRFQDETLDRLKVPREKRLRCSKNFVHQFDRLVVPAMPFPLEEVSAWACECVRSIFSERACAPERLYLSRRGARRRRLVNELHLETSLKSLGFFSVQPEMLSVAEQARLFSSARCVVAPHGASLTNMVFAPRGAMLIELFHPQHKNRSYLNLAAVCGHRYANLEGRATNPATDRHLEYEIEVAAVLQMLVSTGYVDDFAPCV